MYETNQIHLTKNKEFFGLNFSMHTPDEVVNKATCNSIGHKFSSRSLIILNVDHIATLHDNYYYKKLIPHYMLRHKMKSGITGWAQSNYLRGETGPLGKLEARGRFYLYCLEYRYLFFDMKITLLTIIKIFTNKNYY